VQDRVVSVCVAQPDGSVQQVEIGSYPVMGEAKSDAALDSAVKAYDSGRGEWPTMAVAQRIKCVQDFIKRMVVQRHFRCVAQAASASRYRASVEPCAFTAGQRNGQMIGARLSAKQLHPLFGMQ
jgi:hypothetical protein